MRIRILLADDHTIVLEGLRRFLQGQEDIEVVGQAKDGRTAVELTRQLAPDVVIMDISMPILNGIDATRQIHKDQPCVRIIVLSMYPANVHVREMFAVGACGYLLKDCDYQEVLAAIRTVAEGGTYVSANVNSSP